MSVLGRPFLGGGNLQRFGWVIVAGLIAGATPFLPRLLMGAVVLAALTVLIAFRFEAATLAIVALYPLSEVIGDIAPTSQLGAYKDLVVGLLMIVWIIRVCTGHTKIPRSLILGAAGVYAAIAIGMALRAPSLIQAAVGLRTIAFYVGIAFIAATQLADERSFGRMAIAVMSGAVVVTAYDVIKAISPTSFAGDPNAIGYSQLVHENNLVHWSESVFFVADAAILVYIYGMTWKPAVRYTLLCLFAALILLSGNKTAILGVAVAGVVFFLAEQAHGPRRAQALLAIILLGFTAIGLALSGTLSPDSPTVSGRLAELTAYFPIILANPVGYGTGAVSVVLYLNRYSALLPDVRVLVPALHNSVSALLLELGLQGLLGFVMVFVLAIVSWLRMQVKIQEPGRRLALCSCLAITFAIGAEMTISPVILSAISMFYFWLFVGAFVAQLSPVNQHPFNPAIPAAPSHHPAAPDCAARVFRR